MSDLPAIHRIVESDLAESVERGLTKPIPSEHISVLLLVLELNHLLREDEIGDPEQWRLRVKEARQKALDRIIKESL